MVLLKRQWDADLAFCSWVLDVRMTIFENWGRLTQNMFIDK